MNYSRNQRVRIVLHSRLFSLLKLLATFSDIFVERFELLLGLQKTYIIPSKKNMQMRIQQKTL